MNAFFSNAVKELDIQGFPIDKSYLNVKSDNITNIISKFRDYPSILKIKGKIRIINPFSLSKINELDISKHIKSLDINKPTTFNNIPVRLLVDNNDIVSPLFAKIYNESISNLDYLTLENG